MSDHYRVKIFCLNCEGQYITRLLDKTMPRKCKLCGSMKISVREKWRI